MTRLNVLRFASTGPIWRRSARILALLKELSELLAFAAVCALQTGGLALLLVGLLRSVAVYVLGFWGWGHMEGWFRVQTCDGWYTIRYAGFRPFWTVLDLH